MGSGLYKLSCGLCLLALAPSRRGSTPLAPIQSSLFTVHLKRQPKPSEVLEPHSNAGIILGRLSLMWMKAELTKGPHSCPAGPTAPLADLVQHQGR